MKSTKVFFLSILALSIALLLLGWARNSYYAGQVESPLIRVRTFLVIIAGIVIMKKSLTIKGFKVFLIGYVGLWMIYFLLKILANHIKAITGIVAYYNEIIPLETPLPLVFFWVLDQVFFIEKKESNYEGNKH
jgi:hypothetical protein